MAHKPIEAAKIRAHAADDATARLNGSELVSTIDGATEVEIGFRAARSSKS